MTEEAHSSTVKDISGHLQNIINIRRSVSLGFKELLNNNNQNNSIMLPYELNKTEPDAEELILHV